MENDHEWCERENCVCSMPSIWQRYCSFHEAINAYARQYSASEAKLNNCDNGWIQLSTSFCMMLDSSSWTGIGSVAVFRLYLPLSRYYHLVGATRISLFFSGSDPDRLDEHIQPTTNRQLG